MTGPSSDGPVEGEWKVEASVLGVSLPTPVSPAGAGPWATEW